MDWGERGGACGCPLRAVWLFALSYLLLALPAGAQSRASRPSPRAAQVARALRVADARALRGRRAFALFAYARALELDPNNAQAHDGSGRQLLALGLVSDAVPHFRRAALLEPQDAERWALLGDACRAARDWPCAASAYIAALRLAPNARAAAGYDALGGDAFARAYAFSPDGETASDFHPARVDGPAFALGLGAPFAGMGLELSWHFVPTEQPFALAPQVAVGILSPSDTALGFAAGMYAMVGDVDRWVLHAGFAALGRFEFRIYDEPVATRTVYGTTFAFGRRWSFRNGVFLTALLGATFPVDVYQDFVDGAELDVSLGVGYKP